MSLRTYGLDWGMTTGGSTGPADTTSPTVNAGGDHTANASFSRTATASDDGGSVTLQWSQVSGPGTVNLLKHHDANICLLVPRGIRPATFLNATPDELEQKIVVLYRHPQRWKRVWPNARRKQTPRVS